MVGEREAITVGARLERFAAQGAGHASDLEYVAEVGVGIEGQIETDHVRGETPQMQRLVKLTQPQQPPAEQIDLPLRDQIVAMAELEAMGVRVNVTPRDNTFFMKPLLRELAAALTNERKD